MMAMNNEIRTLAFERAPTNKIRAAAKEDDRNVSNWLRRRLVSLDEHGQLVPTIQETEELFNAK